MVKIKNFMRRSTHNGGSGSSFSTATFLKCYIPIQLILFCCTVERGTTKICNTVTLVHAFSSFPTTLQSFIKQSSTLTPSILKHNKIFRTVTLTTTSAATTIDTESSSTTAATFNKEISPFSSSSSSNKFDRYNWYDQWIPVMWARDVPVNKPTKVTVFDIDYVLIRNEDSVLDPTYVGAMIDSCPHKKASLSEGRIINQEASDGDSNKCFVQCAYHGWTFDTADGTCVDIPQVEGRRTRDAKGNHSKDKSNGQAVPAMISQEMIWILPYYDDPSQMPLMERALTVPPPPRIPELDNTEENFKIQTPQIRDFYEVDWTVLLENIMDPDHGMFAHQFTPFDNYVASTKHPQQIDETLSEITETNGIKYNITSKVDAVEKMVARNEVRMSNGEIQEETRMKEQGAKEYLKPDELPKRATTTYYTPYTVHMGRRDYNTNKTNFMTAFWICPIGVGKSRFMACSVAKLPIQIPRFIAHLNVLNFLDQDTFLVATQSRRVLNHERQLLLEEEKVNKSSSSSNINVVPVRKQFYVYRSPTERMGVKVGTFFDSTISRSPGRVDGMTNLPSIEQLPPLTRENVLDRYEQHTKICPDSQKLVAKCQAVQKFCNVGRWIPLFIKLVFLNTSVLSSTRPTHTYAKIVVNAIKFISKPSTILGSMGLLTFMKRIASKLEKEFYFKYTSQLRDRDISNIPKVWADQISS